ncbi:MAG: protein-tyrosine kinase [Lachnospiraceae bacterium]|nr:protein-tyrosine kinase [Lachnospiraceae bacterium]
MNENKRTQQDGEVEINLAELIPYLFHWLWLIAIVSLATAAIAFSIAAFVLTPKYQSTTKVYILSKSGANDNITYQDTQLANYLTKDFKEMVKSRSVLETVIRECNLPESVGTLASNISVSNTTDTRIVGISVKDPDPERAQYLANAVREVAAIHLQEVMDLEAVNMVEEANLPTTPVEPSKKKFTLIGFMIGFVITCVALIINYYMDDSIKTSEDIEKYLGMTTLATIPMFEDEDGTKKKKKRKKIARK